MGAAALQLLILLVNCSLLSSLKSKDGQAAPGFSEAQNTTLSAGGGSQARSAVDLRNEQRLRERWNTFMSERTKQVAFVDRRTSPQEVYVVDGKDLYISCGFNRPLNGKLRLSYLKLAGFSLLSVGKELHTPDPRIEVLNSSRGDVWTLRLRNVSPKDSGHYECILNTEPSLRRLFSVVVIKSHIHLVPSEPVTYVNVGSTLILTCVVDTGPIIPQYILWYKDQKILEYSDDVVRRAKVFTDMAADGSLMPHRSEMVIKNVSTIDSGRYRCNSDLTGEAQVQVYVVEEDFKSLHVGTDTGEEDHHHQLQRQRASSRSPVAGLPTISGVAGGSGWRRQTRVVLPLLWLLWSLFLEPTATHFP